MSLLVHLATSTTETELSFWLVAYRVWVARSSASQSGPFPTANEGGSLIARWRLALPSNLATLAAARRTRTGRPADGAARPVDGAVRPGARAARLADGAAGAQPAVPASARIV